ncbi:Mitochondrial fission 1 protein [Porphyridium purpureum]|uniref:Mitochondrial fission 1 protein n=1 Tax=Porphyridium purpureum TaxID=35688 RepID=A0A5J4YRY9_PORPP|nr:Mitochondrial fission 1 protein [Porphyridium purpureum]|eukprot:POR5689..scf229_5
MIVSVECAAGSALFLVRSRRHSTHVVRHLSALFPALLVRCGRSSTATSKDSTTTESGELDSSSQVTGRNVMEDAGLRQRSRASGNAQVPRIRTPGSESGIEAQVQRFQRAYDEECQRGKVSLDTQFNLAWALIISGESVQVQEGVLLMQLLREARFSDRDCLYYMALGEFQLENLSTSRRLLKELLDISPNCVEAIALLEKVDATITRDGLIGLGIFGAALAAIASVVLGIHRASSAANPP